MNFIALKKKIMIVLDASVYIKIFIEESDSETAYELFSYCLHHKIDIYVPDIFEYEVIHTLSKHNGNITLLRSNLQEHKKSILHIFSPQETLWDIAIEIIQKGNTKSGYPAIYDSMYHAYALQHNYIFLTSDKKHIAKTQELGNIVALKDWKSINFTSLIR